MKNSKKIWIVAALTIVLVAALFVFYLFDPQEINFFPKCTFKSITGYDCPGCGSQRAIHDMLHFDFAGAFSHNPLMLFLIPYLLLGLFFELLGGKKHFPRLEKVLFGKWAAYIVFTIIVLFWVLRNIF